MTDVWKNCYYIFNGIKYIWNPNKHKYEKNK